MRHLTLEALARLVDEAPDTAEAAHLASCDVCGDELDALRTQTEALGTLPELLPPPDAWPEIRETMHREGMIRTAPRRRTGPALKRIAAALALFLAGGAAGFAARGPIAAPGPDIAAESRVALAGGESSTGDPSPTDGPFQAGNPARDLSTEPSGESLGEEVERTEEMFAAALDRFMQASGTEAPDPAARLAALDNIVLTTAEALNESPADPVINSYHLTAVAQRKELIRRLAASDEPIF